MPKIVVIFPMRTINVKKFRRSVANIALLIAKYVSKVPVENADVNAPKNVTPNDLLKISINAIRF